jgi:hypothetical protein
LLTHIRDCLPLACEGLGAARVTVSDASDRIHTQVALACFFLIPKERKIDMDSIRSGLLGGFAASFAASAMMLMNNAIGKIPEIHIAKTLAAMLGSSGALAGWLAFFGIGTIVFGVIFALATPRMPTRSNFVKGLLFGFAIWLGMMLIFMPLAGAGVFGVNRGAIVPLATLALTLIYGIILGIVYGWDAGPAMPASAKKA